MSCGLRRDWLVIWALMISLAAAEISNSNSPSAGYEKLDPEGRIFFNNLNSTLIPLGSGGALLATAVVVVAIIVGAIFIFSIIFNPHALKGGHGLFGPWFGGGYGAGAYGQNAQYQQGGGYYAPQTQPYLYEPYSKLGYQTPQTR